MMHKKMKPKMMYCLAALLVLFLLPCVAFATNSETETIRVGYVSDAGLITTPVVSGSEGYGYEYLNKIVEYTAGDYTLEFVECTWDNYLDKLQSGEIDLFGLEAYDERLVEAGVVYGQNDLGQNILFLSSMSDVTIDTNRYVKVNGSLLGTTVPEEWLAPFFADYKINATVVEIGDAGYVEAYETEGFDFCVISSFQYVESKEVNVLSQIDIVPIYLMAMPENQALLDDFDYAIERIAAKEYQFEETLYNKYYGYDIDINTYISNDEYALLQAQTSYNVGVQNLSSPFSNEDVNGALTGVSVDFLEMVAEAAGINITIVKIDEATTQSVLDTIDFYLFPTEAARTTETSVSYLDIPLILIDHSATLDTVSSVGILTYYGINDMMSGDEIFGRTVTEYTSLEDLRKAFNAGEVESMILTTASLNYIREGIDDNGFLSTNLESSMELVVSYPASFSDEKIEVLNKIILNLDTTALSYSLLRNATQVTAMDLVTLIKENPYIIVGSIAVMLIVIGLVDERRRRALSRRINYDALTGLYSQHRFNIEVEKQRSLHRKRAYRLVSVDIDNFKYINEIYGYTAGTKILKRLSAILKKDIPKDAIVTRAYADNFLIFVRITAEDASLAEYFKKDEAFNQELSDILGTAYKFSFSAGVYDIPSSKTALSYAIDCANVARELGKQTIGTTFHIFSEEINLERAKNNEIAASMEQALASGEFVLYYQPKIDLRTEKIVGAEALVRWCRNGKMIAPYHFIPLFEKNGFIQRLDFEVLSQVCRFLSRNRHLKMPKISVNLSGTTIARADVLANAQLILDKYNISSSQIDIEITESAFVGNHVAQETVGGLEDMGFTISMDDFGAGISSLNRLKNLDIDTLKIDREFIVDYLENEKGGTILKSVIGMAKNLGIETVAEGIETKEQLETLRLYGCDVGQGYYFSRPVEESVYLNSFVRKYNEALAVDAEAAAEAVAEAALAETTEETIEVPVEETTQEATEETAKASIE